jgi:hypothetical protein
MLQYYYCHFVTVYVVETRFSLNRLMNGRTSYSLDGSTSSCQLKSNKLVVNILSADCKEL